MDEDLLNSANNAAASEPTMPTSPAPVTPPVSIPSIPSAQSLRQTQPVQPAKPKKHGTFILVIILSILAVASIVVALLFATGVIRLGDDGPKERPDETPIEEDAIKNNIYEKLSIIFGAPVTDDVIFVDSSDFSDVSLFQDGDLNEEQRLWRVFNAMAESERYVLTEDQISSIHDSWLQSGGDESLFDASKIIAYSGYSFSEKYKEVFGVQPMIQTSSEGRVLYDFELDLYYYIPRETTTSPLQRYYYVSDLVRQGDVAYMYVSGGLYDTTTREAYCNVFFSNTEEKPSICETVEEGGTFTFTSENAGEYGLILLDFYIMPDNNVYFMGQNSVIDADSSSDNSEPAVITPDELPEE